MSLYKLIISGAESITKRVQTSTHLLSNLPKGKCMTLGPPQINCII